MELDKINTLFLKYIIVQYTSLHPRGLRYLENGRRGSGYLTVSLVQRKHPNSSPTDMKEDHQEGEGSRQVTPGFLEVMDLLKNLPEATKSPALQSKFSTTKTAPSAKDLEGTLKICY